jgi:hypothetical protein
MREHSKNIGKKVYFCSYYNDYKINEGILVAVDDWSVKIYCGDLNKVVDLGIKCFNNVIYKWYPHSSWGYTDKNVKQFFYRYCGKNTVKKPEKKYKVYTFDTDKIANKIDSFEEFLSEININIDKKENKYYNRYAKELEKFYNFFHKEQEFCIFDCDGIYIKKEQKDRQKWISLPIYKYYYEGQDESKPFKVELFFKYKPFGRCDEYIKIHKFDKFVETYTLVKGQKYND